MQSGDWVKIKVTEGELTDILLAQVVEVSKYEYEFKVEIQESGKATSTKKGEVFYSNIDNLIALIGA